MSDPTIADATMPSVESMGQPTRGTIIGRYLVLSWLGSGAMGVVLAAYDPELDRKVALKLLKVRGDDQSTAHIRLKREALALAKLNHRNVVAVYDVGVHEGQVFVAMEFVEGRTLREWMISADEPQPWEEVVRILSQAGSGLAAAHDAGLVHRDFKPDNVMLDDGGRVLVMDFGLARAEGDAEESIAPADSTSAPEHPNFAGRLTRTGTLLGTPGYMSTEQFQGRGTDATSDQFGFCVTLYEALYGERPFAATSLRGLIDVVGRGEIRTPPSDSKVPTWLRSVVVRGLATDPRNRFESMHELLDALAANPTARRRKKTVLAMATMGVIGSAWVLWKLGNTVAMQESLIGDQGAELRRRNAELEQQAEALAARDRRLREELSLQRAARASALASQGMARGSRYAIIQAAAEYGPTFDDMPGEIVQAIYDVQLNNAFICTDVLIGQSDTVTNTAFSPDGSHVVTSSADGTARIWRSDGENVAILEDHPDRVDGVFLSPHHVATASGDGTVRIWDYKGSLVTTFDSGAMGALGSAGVFFFPGDDLIATVSYGRNGALRSLSGSVDMSLGSDVTALTLSPDGCCVATGHSDGAVRLWTPSGHVLVELTAHFDDRVDEISFSPDSTRILATTNEKGAARLWAVTGELLANLTDDSESITDVDFLPDGKFVSLMSSSGNIGLWSAAGDAQTVLANHIGSSYISVAPDGERIVTGDRGFARLWARSGLFISQLNGLRPDVRRRVMFTPDGSQVIGAARDNTLHIWDSVDGQMAVLDGHQGRITEFAVSPNGASVATASADNTARLWNSVPVFDPVLHHEGLVQRVAISPDSAHIVTSGSQHGRIHVWTRTGELVTSLQDCPDGVVDVSFAPNGGLLASAGADGSTRVWTLSGELLVVLDGHTEHVRDVEFSPDGLLIATAGSDGAARLWTRAGEVVAVLQGGAGPGMGLAFSSDASLVAISSGNDARVFNRLGEVTSVIHGHSDVVTDTEFSTDGNRIATASADNTARLWSPTGESLAVFEGHTSAVYDIDFAFDGSFVATGSKDKTARLWTPTGDPLHVLRGHGGEVVKVVISQDGALVATVEHDHIVRLWSATTGELLAALEGHSAIIRDIGFSPDGAYIVTGSQDHTARIWHRPKAAMTEFCQELAADVDFGQVAGICSSLHAVGAHPG